MNKRGERSRCSTLIDSETIDTCSSASRRSAKRPTSSPRARRCSPWGSDCTPSMRAMPRPPRRRSRSQASRAGGRRPQGGIQAALPAEGAADHRRRDRVHAITESQANRFLGFVSDAYERNSLALAANKEIAQWEELMGDMTLTTAMLDRILHHARCFSLRGESYRLKHSEALASVR